MTCGHTDKTIIRMDYSTLTLAELVKIRQDKKTPSDEYAIIDARIDELAAMQRAKYDKQRADSAANTPQELTEISTNNLSVATSEEYKARLNANKEQDEKLKQDDINEYDRKRYIMENYAEDDAQEILKREQITGEKFKPEYNPPLRGSARWAREISVIDKSHPQFESMKKHFTRLMRTDDHDATDLLFMERFADKFNPQTNTQITNSNTNNTQIIPQGTNLHDISATALQEGTTHVKAAIKFYESIFKMAETVITKQALELDSTRAHLRKLEKQKDRHEEKLEKLQARKDNSEIKLLRMRKKYLTKHPFVAITENIGEGVKAIKDAFASPEQQAINEQEKADKKAKRKIAENAEIQLMIEQRAQEIAAKILAEKSMK